jgi:DNA-binding NtrC family response regulator
MAKVLVVDDDTDTREALSDWLAHEHEVLLAPGVPEALAILRHDLPDVLVADLEMPPHRGDELLATVAERYPTVGRILHTGAPCRALGFAYSTAHRVFKKGCDLHELSAAIREFVGNRTRG